MAIRSVTFVACFALFVFTAFAETDLTKHEGIDPVDIQKALASAGYYTASIDGIIGQKTRAAIRAFQEANHLKVDGICGPETWSELRAYLGVEPDAMHQIAAEQTVAPEPTRPDTSKLSGNELKQKLVP